MIIKSLARKRPGFRQLISYIGRDNGPVFSRNLYGVEQAEDVAAAFEANHALLPKRKNGNALYHEVIVLPPQPGLTRARQAAILKELAERYCELRAPDNLAWGRIHQDTDNSHIHLMISANAARSVIRTRLPKARFAEIQTEMEREARIRFPDLQDRPIYDRAPSDRSPKRSREDAMERNSGKITRKALIRRQVEYWLPRSSSPEEFQRHLASINLELYRRGNQIGLRDTVSNGRHRLSTLGVDQIVKARQAEWAREAEQDSKAKAAPTQQTHGKDSRAAELLRQRQEQAERATRLLRDFDPER